MKSESDKLKGKIECYETAMKEAIVHMMYRDGAKERKAKSTLLRALGYSTIAEFKECEGIKDTKKPGTFIIDPVSSNSMKSKNPLSGVHSEEYAPTIDTSTQNPSRNQGGLLIVQ